MCACRSGDREKEEPPRRRRGPWWSHPSKERPTRSHPDGLPALPPRLGPRDGWRLHEAFQTVPRRADRFAFVRVAQANLEKREVRPPVVAWRAGDQHVLKRVAAPASVRDEVVVLQPESLEGRMLRGVGAAPGQRLRVSGVHPLADLFAYQRNAAKPAVTAVAVDQRALFRLRRHAERHAFRLRDRRKVVVEAERSAPGAAFAPERFDPVAHGRPVREINQVRRQFAPTDPMGRHRGIEQARRVVNGGDGSEQTGLQLCHRQPAWRCRASAEPSIEGTADSNRSNFLV